MADMEGKKLTELRVIDLKTELERRGLDKSGNKAALLERLSKAISDDGENPEEYLIVPSGGPCKTIPRKNSGTLSQEESIECSDNQKEEHIDRQENVEKPKGEIKAMAEENIEKEVSSKKEEFQPEVKNNTNSKEESLKQEAKIQGIKTTAESVQSSDKNESEKNNTANQSSNASSATVEANGIDNEDSINLTIGEDEENLLAEETESHDRHKGKFITIYYFLI